MRLPWICFSFRYFRLVSHTHSHTNQPHPYSNCILAVTSYGAQKKKVYFQFSVQHSCNFRGKKREREQGAAIKHWLICLSPAIITLSNTLKNVSGSILCKSFTAHQLLKAVTSALFIIYSSWNAKLHLNTLRWNLNTHQDRGIEITVFWRKFISKKEKSRNESE